MLLFVRYLANKLRNSTKLFIQARIARAYKLRLENSGEYVARRCSSIVTAIEMKGMHITADCRHATVLLTISCMLGIEQRG